MEKIISFCDSKSDIAYQPLPVDDPKIRKPDIARAKEVLGWEPEYDLDQGLKHTVAYFQGLMDQGII